MKQKIWLATILCIVMIFTLAGCGSDSGNYESVSTDSINSGMTIGNGISNNSKSEPSYEESYENTDSYSPEENKEQEPEKDAVYKRKIVYTADVSLQTKNMTEARKELDSLIEKYDAYIASENSSNDGDIYSDYKRESLYLEIKVPSKDFQNFLDNVSSENLFVQSLNKTSEDYSTAYYDKQSRINSLRIQEERLLELLANAQSVDVMLQIENNLSNVRYEIESLTREIKFIDSNVEYSTIEVSVREVIKYDEYQPEPKNFFEELVETIKGSTENFGIFMKNLLFTVIYLFPYIVILTVIIIVVSKIKKKRKAKREALRKLKEDQIK